MDIVDRKKSKKSLIDAYGVCVQVDENVGVAAHRPQTKKAGNPGGLAKETRVREIIYNFYGIWHFYGDLSRARKVRAEVPRIRQTHYEVLCKLFVRLRNIQSKKRGDPPPADIVLGMMFPFDNGEEHKQLAGRRSTKGDDPPGRTVLLVLLFDRGEEHNNQQAGIPPKERILPAPRCSWHYCSTAGKSTTISRHALHRRRVSLPRIQTQQR